MINNSSFRFIAIFFVVSLFFNAGLGWFVQEQAALAAIEPVIANNIQGNDFWSQRGPRHNLDNLEGPQVNQIVTDPTAPHIVYAATNQGVYRSSNGGNFWEPRNGGLGGFGDLVVSSLVIHPNDPEILFIGTWGHGVLRSNDSGQNWTRLNDPLETETTISGKAISPEVTPPRVAGAGPGFGDPHYNSLFAPEFYDNPLKAIDARSKEASNHTEFLDQPAAEQPVSPQGQPITWSRTAVRQVALNPANPNEILVAVDDGYGLYRSVNGGETWSKVPLGTGSARTYAFAPSNNQVRYASFGDWTTSGGFFRSANGGENWSEIGVDTIEGTVISVAIHPNNANIVLAGTSGDGLYRSVDGGVSWTKVSQGLGDSSFYSVAFAASDPTQVYAGGFNWVYRSANSGQSFSIADTNFPAYYISGLAIHPADPQVVLVGSNMFLWGGVYRRTSTNASFSFASHGMEETFVLSIAQDPVDPAVLYASTWGAGFFRSNDGGLNWNNSNRAVPYLYTIEAVQGGPNEVVLYAGTFYSDYGILRSYDRGNTWTEVSRVFPSYISFDLQTTHNNPDRLIAATHHGIQFSTNGGVTWGTASNLNQGIVLRLCEFPGTGRMLAATYGGGIFYSSGGWTWYEANQNITGFSQFTYDVACSSDTPGLAYAGSLGVYRTTDYGETWAPMKSGLPNDYIRALDIAPATGDVIAGANSEGVFVSVAGHPIWQAIKTGLLEKRIRSVKAVSAAPLKLFAGTNGASAWEYTAASPLYVGSVYLPVIAREYAHTPLDCRSYEPNDSFQEAQPLPAPGTYCSFIYDATDTDYYRFDITETGPIIVELTNIPAGTDYDLELYDSNQTLVGGSWMGGNQNERIVFQPARTGRYYVRVYPYSGSDSEQGYHLTVSYNTPAASEGQIYGQVRHSNNIVADVPVILYYYNGYRSARLSSVTDNGGVYRFRGLPSLPIGHYYWVSYPNYENNSQRLSSWSCYITRDYNAGEDLPYCTFDIVNLWADLPPGGAIQPLPVLFTWNSRNVAGDEYRLRLRSLDSSAYWLSPGLGASTSYTLNSLPAGFDYGVTYYWDVLVFNQYGSGTPYFMRSITFSNTLGQVDKLMAAEDIPQRWFKEMEESPPIWLTETLQLGDER